MFTTSQILVTLPPRQVISKARTLSDWVDLTQPGRYRITASRHFDTVDETDVSNIIEVSIP